MCICADYSTKTGQARVSAPAEAARASQAADRAPAPLSTAHNGTQNVPHVEFYQGSSFLKVSRGLPGSQSGGGKRGTVTRFTRASRRRLMRKLSQVRRDAVLPWFVTLTYPARYPSARKSKVHMKAFRLRLMRRYPDAGAVWRLEYQLRGAPHYHLLVWGVNDSSFPAWVARVWYEIAGGGDTNHLLFHLGRLPNSRLCAERVRSWRGVWSYVSKYLAKVSKDECNESPGRFWGIWGNVPFGVLMAFPVSRRWAVQVLRLMRRYAHMRGRAYASLTIICDADQWVSRLAFWPPG